MKRYFAKNPIALLLLIITYSLANTDTDVAISSIIVQQPISVLSPAPTTTPLNDTANWTIYRGQSHPDLAWPWKKIEADHATFPATANAFPKQFLWGVGTSAYQVEENCTNSTYASWEKISQHYTHKAGNTCEHTKRFKDDVQLIKNSGMSTYRFSIEWSKIEPKEGIFDYAAISHYAAVIKELIGNNIKPIIGFHHYSDPQWFMDKGGFAVPENIKLFVRFCHKVHKALEKECSCSKNPNNLRPLWITFNSPSSYAANGYITGTRPPGNKSIQTALEVLKNMLDAHVYVYQSIKKNHPQATIGITHNIYQIDASNPYNPIHNLRRYFANKIAHTTMYEFFTRGTFNHRIPLVASVQHTNRHAPQSIDFVGLNYYGHGYIGTTGTTQRPTDEIPTQNPLYSIYAEGIYRAIKEISDNLTTPLQIPLYITENGVATDDDATRDLFLKRYLYAISKAIKDGYPVHGYIHWSLMDNYEWGSYDKKYGIYAVDRSVDAQTGKPKLNRTLRKGARYLIDLVHKHGQSA